MVEPFRGSVGTLLADSFEQAVTDVLASMVAFAEAPPDGPQFVWAHVHSPHPPFTLGDNRLTLPACVPTTCTPWDPAVEQTGVDPSSYREALEAELAGLDELVLAALRRVVSADSSAVVIVFSDHGSRASLENAAEHFRVLLAARTPDEREVIDRDEATVNVLRDLVSTYLGAGLPRLPYRAWISDWTATLSLTPVNP